MSTLLRAITGFPRFVLDVGKAWYYGGIGDLAAGVTFWILITVPAAVLTLVSSVSFIDAIIGANLTGEIRFEVLKFVNRVFSEEASAVYNEVAELFERQNLSVFTVAAGLTLFTISRGFAGMIRALDTVYGVEDGRAWYHTRFVGLVLGLGTVMVVVPIILLEVFVWDTLSIPFEGTIRPLTAMTILVGWASIIFHYGPSTRSKWRWDLPGAVVAALFWWGLTVGYALYVDLVGGVGTGDDVYAILGGFLLALTWIWLAAQVLLIGAAVNAVLGERLGLSRGKRRSVLNAALSTATGELKKVVVNSGRTNGDDDTAEFTPKAVVQRFRTTGRARSVLAEVDDTQLDLRPRQRIGSP